MLSRSSSLTFMSSHVLCLLPGTLSWLAPASASSQLRGSQSFPWPCMTVGLCICPPATLKIPISHPSIEQVHVEHLLWVLQNPTFLPSRSFHSRGDRGQGLLPSQLCLPGTCSIRHTVDSIAIFFKNIKKMGQWNRGKNQLFLCLINSVCCFYKKGNKRDFKFSWDFI